MADTQKLHPATLVTNIKTCIPIVLDYDGTQYNTWYTLFELHCRTNLVLDHINPPVVDDKDSEVSENAQTAQWQRLDDIVRQWIYNTISTDLLNSIIDPDEKVIDAWNRLKEFFPNNKSTRALHLDAQFTNTKLDQFDGVKPYCTRLKTLAYSLRNVGDKVSDNRMALQLLKGLSEEYKPFRTSVRHLNPLPSFDTLRSMLELEEQGNAADIAVDSHEEAHVSQSPSMIPKSGGEQTQSSGNSRGSTPRNGGRKNNKGKGSGHAGMESNRPWMALKNLCYLTLDVLSKLSALPEGLQYLTFLRSLKILYCKNLVELPEWISSLVSLQILKLSYYHNLVSLPEGIKLLNSLVQLDIVDCPGLYRRCRSPNGEDRFKIQHIPFLSVRSSL
uniref:Uncharacterized protein n=1 Tax=Chenopodium quinoa TaxID=63459 RepID=A0A803M609_CHEQI